MLLLVARHDHEALGGNALQLRQPSGIHRHLEQGRDLEPARELGVRDVVGPRAEVAGSLGAQQEVGVADPRPVVEGGLVDDVDALAHRGERRRLGRLAVMAEPVDLRVMLRPRSRRCRR